MTRSFRLLRLAAFSVLLCGPALHPTLAQSTLNGSTPEPVLQEADADDRDFVRTLGESIASEGAIAALAARTTRNAEIRSLALGIRNDRRRASSELSGAAAGAGFVPPDGPDAAERALERDLRSKPASDFDQAFLERLIQMDQSALDTLDREISGGYNRRLTAFAQARKHLVGTELGAAQDAFAKFKR